MSIHCESNVGRATRTCPKVLGASVNLKQLAEPFTRGDKIKAMIARAARRAGLSYWRAFDLWYAKARRVEPYELAAIETALQAKRDEEARNEFRELKTRLLRLESRLVQTDAEFHREDISALQSTVRQRG
jgi:hypothetical protein